MALTVPAEQQLLLLDLADLDQHLTKLRHDIKNHPLRAEIATLAGQIAATDRRITEAEAASSTASTRADSLSDDVDQRAAHIAEQEARLNSGEGMTSRDLLTLQDEINGLKAALSAVEDEALEAVSAAEDAAATVAGEKAVKAEQVERLEALTHELEREVAARENEVTEVMGERGALAARLDAEMVDEYERARGLGGFGVIALYPNGTTNAGIELAPTEVALIRSLERDDLYVSEEYDCLVVRV